jgi:hypothetical protein
MLKNILLNFVMTEIVCCGLEIFGGAGNCLPLPFRIISPVAACGRVAFVLAIVSLTLLF